MSEVIQVYNSSDRNMDLKNFSSIEEFRSFLEKSIEDYKWINYYAANESCSNIVQSINGGLQNLDQMTRLVLDDSEAFRSGLRTKINEIFGEGGLPITGTARFSFINDLRNYINGETAIGAIAFYMNKMDVTSDKKLFRGYVLAANNENSEWINIEKLALDLRSEYDRLNEIIDRDINNIRSVTEKYEKAIPLKASVDYWEKKAGEHKENSLRYLRKLTHTFPWFGLGLLAGLVVLIWCTHINIDKTASIGAYIGPATIGILLTSVALWAARICVRLYMSEHHLYIDAAERAVIIKTFVALSQEKILITEDRTLFIAPIFRSSADGIVKDDGAPDASIAALLSKLLSAK